MTTKQIHPGRNHELKIFRKALALATSALAFLSLSAEAAQGPQPPICNRACWVARAPTCGITQMSALTRAIIHHTAGASDYSTDINNSKATMRGVQNLHINNGWCDIAYHFLVDAAGNVFEGRSGSLGGLPRGTHDGNNSNSFGFTMLGYFHPPYNHNPNGTMRSKLYDVIAWRMPSGWSPYGSGTYNGNNVGFLDGHRKVKATACPGDGMWPFIGDNTGSGEARNGVNCRKNGTCAGPSSTFGDLDGDGRTDYALFRPATGVWYTRTSVSGVVGSWQLGQNGDIPLMGNWTTPAGAELAVFRPSAGLWYIRFQNGSVASFSWGVNGDIPLIGAWSGQMRDQALFRPSNGNWYIRYGDTGTTVSFPWGQSGDIPLVGAWSGQMRDQALFRPSNGTWYIRFGDTGITATVPWGQNGDIPLVGAWSGQMRDQALFRPSNGTWYIRLGDTGVTVSVPWGQNGDMPMVGNVFGNGMVDQILFRPSTGMWYVRDGKNGGTYTFGPYGQNGDKLVHQ